MQRFASFICLRQCLLTFTLFWLAGCGGSSDGDSSDYEYAYLQFYHASPNGASVIVREVDGDTIGSAQFGDSTPLVSVENGEIELEFIRMDSDDQEVLLDTMTVTLQTAQKSLIVLSGDFSQPQFSLYQFDRESLDSHFRLFLLGATLSTEQYDVYMSEEGEPFSAANFLGTSSLNSLQELTFWNGDDDSLDFDIGEYTLYLTLPGEQTVQFESPTTEFEYATEYVLAIRDVSGAIQQGITADLVLNSTTVTHITDVNADSQYRIYNSTNYETPVVVQFGENDEDIESITLQSGQMSAFTPIAFGDYRLTVTGPDEVEGLSNKLVTLNQGVSKAILIYEAAGKLNAVTLTESGLPQTYDKTVNFVNLVSDFESIDIYLVRKDETVDSAEYTVGNLSPAEHNDKVLPADYYEVVAVYTDDNGEQTLLDRTSLVGFNEDTNYIVTVEVADTPTGYEVVVLHD